MGSKAQLSAWLLRRLIYSAICLQLSFKVNKRSKKRCSTAILSDPHKVYTSMPKEFDGAIGDKIVGWLEKFESCSLNARKSKESEGSW